MAHAASGDKCKFCLSPLHIKISLIKISVQTMGKWNEEFDFLRAKISKKKCDQYERSNFRLSTNYTNVRRPRLSTKLNCTGRGAWTASEHVCINFLGNEKAENFSKIVRGSDFIKRFYGVCRVIETSFSGFLFGFFLKTWQPSRANMVIYAIIVFHLSIWQIEKGYSGNGVPIFWLIADGVL